MKLSSQRAPPVMAVRWAMVDRSASARTPPAERLRCGIGWVVQCGSQSIVTATDRTDLWPLDCGDLFELGVDEARGAQQVVEQDESEQRLGNGQVMLG